MDGNGMKTENMYNVTLWSKFGILLFHVFETNLIIIQIMVDLGSVCSMPSIYGLNGVSLWDVLCFKTLNNNNNICMLCFIHSECLGPSENDGMTLANVFSFFFWMVLTKHTIWGLNYDICYSLVSLFGKCYTLMPDNSHDIWNWLGVCFWYCLMFISFFVLLFFTDYHHVEWCSMIHLIYRRLEAASSFAFYNIHHPAALTINQLAWFIW